MCLGLAGRQLWRLVGEVTPRLTGYVCANQEPVAAAPVAVSAPPEELD